VKDATNEARVSVRICANATLVGRDLPALQVCLVCFIFFFIMCRLSNWWFRQSCSQVDRGSKMVRTHHQHRDSRVHDTSTSVSIGGIEKSALVRPSCPPISWSLNPRNSGLWSPPGGLETSMGCPLHSLAGHSGEGLEALRFIDGRGLDYRSG